LAGALARWRDGRTSFHEGHPNALLARHLARLAGCRRVLVEFLGERPYGSGKCMQSGVSATERGLALRFDERR
jgi:hypothetical protein